MGELFEIDRLVPTRLFLLNDVAKAKRAITTMEARNEDIYCVRQMRIESR